MQHRVQLNQQVAQLYERGQYTQAIEPAGKLCELVSQILGEENPNFAVSLDNLALLYQVKGEYGAAQPLHERALAIREQVLELDHPDMAQSLDSLAGLYRAKGDYGAAQPLHERALAIREQTLGPAHPDTATSLRNLAELYAAMARPETVLSLMQHASIIRDRLIGQVFAIASDSQRTAYLKTIEGGFDAFLSLIFQYLSSDATAVRAALDLVLRRKAIGAEALEAQRDAVLGGQYPHLEPQLRQLMTLREQIIRKRLSSPEPEGLEAYTALLAEWEARKNRLEADLARQIPEMNLEQRLRNVAPGCACTDYAAWCDAGGGRAFRCLQFHRRACPR